MENEIYPPIRLLALYEKLRSMSKSINCRYEEFGRVDCLEDIEDTWTKALKAVDLRSCRDIVWAESGIEPALGVDDDELWTPILTCSSSTLSDSFELDEHGYWIDPDYLRPSEFYAGDQGVWYPDDFDASVHGFVRDSRGRWTCSEVE